MSSNSANLRILWLKSGPLHPPDMGGKIRTYNMLRELNKKHHITYMALCPPAVDESIKQQAAEYSRDQIWIPWSETPKRSAAFLADLTGNLFSPLPYVIAKYKSAEMARKIAEEDKSGALDLIVCDFLFPAINVFGAIERLRTPALLFQHNVESLIWKRTFESAENIVTRSYFRGQWRRLWKYEKETCGRFDAVVGVSDEDCRLMRTEYGLTNVLGAVPTGVNLSFFEQTPRNPKANHIAFLGSMEWMPNIDAVKYFADEIWPLLKSRVPELRFTIIGKNPPPAVARLAQKDSGIQVTGTVPDVRPFLAEAQAVVVPLRVGGGTRLKIFEAMAAGIPVVSTSIGMEGLPLTHREDILVADTSSSFAEATEELLRNADLGNRLADNARRLVRERFSWERATEIFTDYCYGLVGQ